MAIQNNNYGWYCSSTIATTVIDTTSRIKILYPHGDASTTWSDVSFNYDMSGPYYGWDTITSNIEADYYFITDPPRISDRLSQIIKDRQSPAIHTNRRSSAVHPGDFREMRARETLRMMIGEERYHRFLRKGFILANNPKSGYTYQIFHSRHHFTHVWKDGKMVQRLCIYLKGDFPPTDFVITMYLLALNNDQRIWQVGNKYAPVEPQQHPQQLITNPRSLVEIYRELKSA